VTGAHVTSRLRQRRQRAVLETDGSGQLHTLHGHIDFGLFARDFRHHLGGAVGDRQEDSVLDLDDLRGGRDEFGDRSQVAKLVIRILSGDNHLLPRPLAIENDLLGDQRNRHGISHDDSRSLPGGRRLFFGDDSCRQDQSCGRQEKSRPGLRHAIPNSPTVYGLRHGS
jgi:hypothetical protein